MKVRYILGLFTIGSFITMFVVGYLIFYINKINHTTDRIYVLQEQLYRSSQMVVHDKLTEENLLKYLETLDSTYFENYVKSAEEIYSIYVKSLKNATFKTRDSLFDKMLYYNMNVYHVDTDSIFNVTNSEEAIKAKNYFYSDSARLSQLKIVYKTIKEFKDITISQLEEEQKTLNDARIIYHKFYIFIIGAGVFIFTGFVFIMIYGLKYESYNL
jgi:CHASE3 domain sensor protein